MSAEAQRWIASAAACSRSSTRAGEEETTIVLVSSAKQFVGEGEADVTESIYRRKSVGPRTVPCGTPAKGDRD